MADNLNKILYNYYMAEIKNYYRKITELLQIRFKLFIKNLEKDFLSAMKKENIKLQFANFTILFLIMLFIFLLIYGALSYLDFLKITEERKSAENSLSYWEEIIGKHPNVPDSYYNAAIYAVSLKQKSKAIDYVGKALRLDSDFKEALELGDFLESDEMR